MAYARGRTFYDADSHIMELPDHMWDYAEPDVRERLPRLPLETMAGRIGRVLEDLGERQAHSPEHVSELLALGDDLISGPKGYEALGAFNGTERGQALDLLGFDRQLVFPSFAEMVAFDPKLDTDLQYSAARAANRAMAAFCSDDPRLLGVGVVPLEDPKLAVAETEQALELGLAAIWVPHRSCGGRSPGHDELDDLWACLADASVPFLLHVGGAPLQLDPVWMNTGRPLPTDWLGGGENVRGKDMTSLHHLAETFLGALVLDGVLERHPRLRGGAIELGAGWVPAMLERLDWIAHNWRRSEPELQKLEGKPSEQITEQLAFTPFVYEDVGELIRRSNDRLYLFSSDYPHIEGGRNPLGRFGNSLEDSAPETLDRFYSHNFADMFRLEASA